MLRFLVLTVAALAAGSAALSHPGSVQDRRSAEVQRGRILAEARCAACHAITPDASSPNPESPGFEDIANRRGLTAATLRQYLRDAHNYPEAMQFRLEKNQVRDLAAYLVTLKQAAYKPAI